MLVYKVGWGWVSAQRDQGQGMSEEKVGALRKVLDRTLIA